MLTLTVSVNVAFVKDGYEICFVGDEAFRELSQVRNKRKGETDYGAFLSSFFFLLFFLSSLSLSLFLLPSLLIV